MTICATYGRWETELKRFLSARAPGKPSLPLLPRKINAGEVVFSAPLIFLSPFISFNSGRPDSLSLSFSFLARARVRMTDGISAIEIIPRIFAHNLSPRVDFVEIIVSRKAHTASVKICFENTIVSRIICTFAVSCFYRARYARASPRIIYNN